MRPTAEDFYWLYDVPAWKGLPIEEHAGVVTWRAPLAPGSGEVPGPPSPSEYRFP